MPSSPSQLPSAGSIPWWGWAGAGVLLFWAAGSGTWRPVIVLGLVAILLVNFRKAIAPKG